MHAHITYQYTRETFHINKLKIKKHMQTLELIEGKHCTVYTAWAILIAKLIKDFKFLILKNANCIFWGHHMFIIFIWFSLLQIKLNHEPIIYRITCRCTMNTMNCKKCKERKYTHPHIFFLYLSPIFLRMSR